MVEGDKLFQRKQYRNLYVFFLLLSGDFHGLYTPTKRGQLLFIGVIGKILTFCTTFVIYVISKYFCLERYKRKYVKNFKFFLRPNFLSICTAVLKKEKQKPKYDVHSYNASIIKIQ